MGNHPRWLAGVAVVAAVVALAGCTGRDEVPVTPTTSEASVTATATRPRPTQSPTSAGRASTGEPDCYGSRFEACLKTSITLDTPGVTSPDCAGTEKRICLVPMGAVRPDLIEHLSSHFREMGLPFEVLPGIDIDAGIADVQYSQASGKDLLDLMRERYPVLQGWDAVGIALTPIDIRSEEGSRGSFLFAQQFGWGNERLYGVISAFRFSPETFGEPRDDELYFSRVRKMLLKYMGTEYFGYLETDSADSVMRVFINSLDLLDSLPERLPADEPPCRQQAIRICLVPVGDVDAEMLQRVADDAERVYGLFVDVLPGTSLDPQYRNLVGLDYDADRVLQTMWAAYPVLTRAEPAPLLVAVTDEAVSLLAALQATNDPLVLAAPNFGPPAAVISTHGLEDDGQALLELRLRKLLAQEIGVVAMGMELSDQPGSPFPYWIQTAEQVDALPERLPGY